MTGAISDGGAVENEGNPQLRTLGRKGEGFPHDAHHRVAFAIQDDRSIHDVWITAETASPKSVAQHDDRGAARSILVG